MSNPDSFPKPNSTVPDGNRPSAAPRVNAPVRPQQRPPAPAGAPGQRPAAPGQGPAQGPAQGSTQLGQRPVSGPRPAPAGQRPAPVGQRPGPQGQRPATGQGSPGLVKPAPKAKVRRARLLISKVDPWSVLKMAFLLSVALGIVTVVAAIVLWTVLDLTGIFDQVDSLLGTLAGSEGRLRAEEGCVAGPGGVLCHHHRRGERGFADRSFHAFRCALQHLGHPGGRRWRYPHGRLRSSFRRPDSCGKARFEIGPGCAVKSCLGPMRHRGV